MGPRGAARLTVAVAAVALAAALRASTGGGQEEGGEGCGGLRGVTAVLGNNTHQVSGGRGGRRAAGREERGTPAPPPPGGRGTDGKESPRPPPRCDSGRTDGQSEAGRDGLTPGRAPGWAGDGRTDGRGAPCRLLRCRQRSVLEPVGRLDRRTDRRTAAVGDPVLPGWDRRTDGQLRHAPVDERTDGRTDSQTAPSRSAGCPNTTAPPPPHNGVLRHRSPQGAPALPARPVVNCR